VWEALRHSIKGVSLWVPVPFYMTGVRDWAACARIVKFLDKRLNLNLETGNLDRQAERQNKAIAELSGSNAEIAGIMNKFSANSGITEAESARLSDAIEDRLGRGDCY